MTQPVASDIGVGAVLRDTYEITSLLGKGGMGAVYLARHRRLPGKQVAVKVLLNSASLNPELYARFRREAEIASQLGHPNIVEVSDFDTLQDGTPFLVMEYLRGESLEHRLGRGRMSLTDTLALTRQIGSALQAAHRAGVVHRDLKPANVFLVPTDSEGLLGERVKLLDFGISKMLDSSTLQTQEAVLIGTPQYMAPEQAMGKNSEVGPRTDLFALGCIVYEMLSGRPPFAGEGSSLVQVIFRVVHAQPESLASLCPEVPRQVIEAVEQALAKSSQDRPTDVSAFIASLTGVPLAAPSGAAVPMRSQTRSGEPSGTAQFGGPAAARDDGLGATHMPSSTAQFGASGAAAQDDGLGATHMPSSTARFPSAAAVQDDGLGATHMPSSTARIGSSAAAAQDDGLGATHMPASTARMALAEPPRASPAPVAAVSPTPVAPVPPAPMAVAPAVPRPVPARSSRWAGPLAGLGVLAVLAVGVGVWRSSHPPSPVQPVPPAEPRPVLPTPPTEPATGPVAVPQPPPQTPDTSKPVAASPGVPKPGTHPGTPTPAERPGAPESEEILQQVKQAETLLGQGESQSVIELALRNLRQAPESGSTYSVLTRAYCDRQDLSNVNSTWRRGLKYMSSKEASKTRTFCARKDISLK